MASGRPGHGSRRNSRATRAIAAAALKSRRDSFTECPVDRDSPSLRLLPMFIGLEGSRSGDAPGSYWCGFQEHYDSAQQRYLCGESASLPERMTMVAAHQSASTVPASHQAGSFPRPHIFTVARENRAFLFFFFLKRQRHCAQMAKEQAWTSKPAQQYIVVSDRSPQQEPASSRLPEACRRSHRCPNCVHDCNLPRWRAPSASSRRAYMSYWRSLSMAVNPHSSFSP